VGGGQRANGSSRRVSGAVLILVAARPARIHVKRRLVGGGRPGRLVRRDSALRAAEGKAVLQLVSQRRRREGRLIGRTVVTGLLIRAALTSRRQRADVPGSLLLGRRGAIIAARSAAGVAKRGRLATAVAEA
jgi:hypothetical protein